MIYCNRKGKIVGRHEAVQRDSSASKSYSKCWQPWAQRCVKLLGTGISGEKNANTSKQRTTRQANGRGGRDSEEWGKGGAGDGAARRRIFTPFWVRPLGRLVPHPRLVLWVLIGHFLQKLPLLSSSVSSTPHDSAWVIDGACAQPFNFKTLCSKWLAVHMRDGTLDYLSNSACFSDPSLVSYPALSRPVLNKTSSFSDAFNDIDPGLSAACLIPLCRNSDNIEFVCQHFPNSGNGMVCASLSPISYPSFPTQKYAPSSVTYLAASSFDPPSTNVPARVFGLLFISFPDRRS
ncbi:hypothetical protein FISHEDRAFT_56320 [Fistulina hepatica ATCC 64428]|uniref:Uncharacterized protein n=1 Tax=Fistulina hepatica ATCC 64428 TaxID=1128425 RepID=A0A0D7AJ00_9AGAR|nr:hypothetical protein FISHEDRAFT_56320 [Fistulina hepatica ATCC 64428]